MMPDMMMEIYNALKNNAQIADNVKVIKFFDYPNANEVKEPIIVIDDLSTPIPSDFADDDNLTYQYIYQIDVFVKNAPNINARLLSSGLVLSIQSVMWNEFKFGVNSSGKPEYIKDFNLYRQTLSFTGKIYKTETEQL